MAIKIPRNTVADHVVFDRIVDADRTIKLAREAAAKAEAAGKQDIADKLNAKADALEKILLATKQPEYDEEEEPPENVGGGGNDPGSQSGGNQDSKNTESQSGEDEEQDDQTNGSGGSSSQKNDQEETDPQDSENGEGDGKTPEDIANMDQHNGSHASGTQQIGGGGGGSSSNQGKGEGGGESGANNQSNSNQQNNKKGGQQELDPFRLQQARGNGQQKSPTPEEILAAVIKRLNGLGGNAKAGADRALRKLFDELGGTGDIDD